MEGRKGFLNEKGSSLIIVIVGAAFLGILGALILSITFTNIDLKTANNKSKDNFYVEEVVVNQITAKLEEYEANSYSTAYAWLVENYNSEVLDLRECYDDYKQKYMIALSQYLNGNPAPSATSILADKYNVSVLQGSLQSFVTHQASLGIASVKVFHADPTVVLTEGEIENSKDASGNPTYDYLTLKDVSITYEDLSGYETTIVTDITFEQPLAAYLDTTFAKYALISDQLVECSNSVEVKGGVYGGRTETAISRDNAGDAVNANYGGIWVHNITGNLKIDGGGNIVAARKNITASNNGKLSIKNAKVWAENIATMGEGADVDGTPTLRIDILDSVTKVKDDLTIKSKDSSVKMTGDYYGFSYISKDAATSRTTSDTSSSITVNAKNISLDLSGLNTFALFGRAFISSNVNNDGGGGEDVSKSMMDIMTGQSLAVKNDQGAYLIPADNYLKIGSNPIDIDDLKAYAQEQYDKNPSAYPGFDANVSYLSLDPKTDIVDFTKGDAVEIQQYLDPAAPVRAIFYKQGTGAGSLNRVNYYFNFKDEQSANAYFKYYYLKNKGEMNEVYKTFYRLDGSGYSLKLNPDCGRFQVAGDILYQNGAGTFEFATGDVNGIEDESKQLTNAYHSVSVNLREDGSIVKDIDKTAYFDSHFQLDKIKSHPTAFTIPSITASSNVDYREAGVYISNENTFIVDDTMSGLVIASGDVVVEAVKFEGVIIADGTITLSRASKLYANEELILKILDYCRSNGNTLGQYIKGYDALKTLTSKDEGINYADAIYFENWRRNV